MPVTSYLARPRRKAAWTSRPADTAGLRAPPFEARWAGRPAGEWPLHSFLELGALDGAVPSARLHARYVLREWEGWPPWPTTPSSWCPSW